MKNTPVYETKQIDRSPFKIQFFFESNGKEKITKVIEYAVIDYISNKAVFNLGFGDYDEKNDTFYDDVNSNNGDLYTVFNTVLNTAELFFTKFPNAVILIGGSDSNEDFQSRCIPTCKKNCSDICKNANRRIKIYRYFLNKNFEELSLHFVLFGYNKMDSKRFVQYILI